MSLYRWDSPQFKCPNLSYRECLFVAYVYTDTKRFCVGQWNMSGQGKRYQIVRDERGRQVGQIWEQP